jgi:hypothetical protein
MPFHRVGLLLLAGGARLFMKQASKLARLALTSAVVAVVSCDLHECQIAESLIETRSPPNQLL